MLKKLFDIESVTSLDLSGNKGDHYTITKVACLVFGGRVVENWKYNNQGYEANIKEYSRVKRLIITVATCILFPSFILLGSLAAWQKWGVRKDKTLKGRLKKMDTERLSVVTTTHENSKNTQKDSSKVPADDYSESMPSSSSSPSKFDSEGENSGLQMTGLVLEPVDNIAERASAGTTAHENSKKIQKDSSEVPADDHSESMLSPSSNRSDSEGENSSSQMTRSALRLADNSVISREKSSAKIVNDSSSYDAEFSKIVEERSTLSLPAFIKFCTENKKRFLQSFKDAIENGRIKKGNCLQITGNSNSATLGFLIALNHEITLNTWMKIPNLRCNVKVYDIDLSEFDDEDLNLDLRKLIPHFLKANVYLKIKVSKNCYISHEEMERLIEFDMSEGKKLTLIDHAGTGKTYFYSDWTIQSKLYEGEEEDSTIKEKSSSDYYQSQAPIDPYKDIRRFILNNLDNTHKVGRNSYRIKSLICDSGGAGDVFLAENIETNERVAIKILRHSWDHEHLNMVKIRNAGGHDNVVKLIDHTLIFEKRWIVMEYVHGVTRHEYGKWDDTLEQQFQSARKFIRQAGAEWASENQGNNILITTVNGKPTVKLVDFSLGFA